MKALSIATSCAVVLFILSGVLFVQNNQLQQKTEVMQTSLDSADAEFNELQNNLEGEISSLRAENVELQSKLEHVEKGAEELNQSYQSLEENFDEVNTQVQDVFRKTEILKKEINESIHWFKDNTNLSGVDRGDILLKNLRARCIEIRSKTCTIKLSCLFLVNDDDMKYHYIDDILATEEYDKLLSLEEFAENKGGDCEDYSLFFKAEMNELINICKEQGAENIEIEAMVLSSNPNVKYFLDFNEYWYLEQIKGHDLSEGFIHPNVVCGTFYFEEDDELGGHCVIGFTTKEVMEIDDLSIFDGAPIIEPQNGMYYGNLTMAEDRIYYENKKMSIIISDEDMFIFSEEFQEWVSYHSLYEEVSLAQEQLPSQES